MAITNQARKRSAASDGERPRIVTIPVGSEHIRYSSEYGVEMPRHGPAALAILEPNTFLIANTMADSVLQYDQNGQLLKTISLPRNIGPAIDLEARDSTIWVLTFPPAGPMVTQLTLAGDILLQFLVAEDEAERVTGLATDHLGAVALELDNGLAILRFVDSKGELLPRSELDHDRIITIVEHVPPGSIDRAAQPTILLGEQRIVVEKHEQLGGLRLLGFDADGNGYVSVEEVRQGATIEVDKVVHKYAPDGTFIGAARLPQRYTTYVNNPLAVDANDLYVLHTRSRHVEIIRLEFSASLRLLRSLEQAAVLPAPPELPTDQIAAARLASISRDRMISIAREYVFNTCYMSEKNIKQVGCIGRTKPRYLGAPGKYHSVSYKWGGNHEVTEFNDCIHRQQKAGDISIGETLACACGIDCSGFVGRCWGIAKKYGTLTLKEITIPIEREQLRQGDILNLRKKHVVLVDRWNRQNIVTYESTTAGKFDRVVHFAWSWDYVAGYEALRFRAVRDPNVPPYAPGQYRVRFNGTKIRTGPGTDKTGFPVAWDGNAKLQAGHVLDFDSFKEGEDVNGNTWWGHMRSGDGFVSMALVDRA